MKSRERVRLLAVFPLAMLWVLPVFGQTSRIAVAGGAGRTVKLTRNTNPRALSRLDQGPAPESLVLSGIRLVFQQSAEQQAAREELLRQQQDPASAQFHQWLTPETYASRFGLNKQDTAKIQAWLESLGFRVERIARSRTWISFSATAGEIARGLGTEIHWYAVDGETHFANSSPPSVPESLATVILGFEGLDDFRPAIPRRGAPTRTSAATSDHKLTPAAIATIYNIAPLYPGTQASSQTIAIVGEAPLADDDPDIAAFRQTFPPANPFTTVEVQPSTPSASALSGLQREADLDIEWSGAIAPGAAIRYYYAPDAMYAAESAIDDNMANVLSMSYDYCEPESAWTEPLVVQAFAQQANAQGMTWLAASGDSGAAGCDAHHTSPIATDGLAVSLPASVPEVTGVGGTEFSEGTGDYWSATSPNTPLGYIPEIAWNDSVWPSLLATTGGGNSIFFARPAWQTGPGVLTGSAREVPDLSFSASGTHDPYMVYSGGEWITDGGTSVSTPLMAGVVALLNDYLSQNNQGPGRLGNINPGLYALARTAGTVFHDITVGSNVVPCEIGTPDCTGGSYGYLAGPGYDLTTGLGSLDVYNLVSRWYPGETQTSTAAASSVSSVSVNDSFTLSATVTASGTGVPSGSVAFIAVAGGFSTPLASAPISSSGGTAVASATVGGWQLPVGPSTIMANYSGDGTFQPSSGSLSMAVTLPANGPGVVPSVNPNPIPEQPEDASGYRWHFTINLTELAGFPATLTKLLIDNVDYTAAFVQDAGEATIGPNQQLSAKFNWKGATPPDTKTFAFALADAAGNSWTETIPVSFYGPEGAIYSVANSASGAGIFAPGMWLTVEGINLAPFSSNPGLPYPTALYSGTFNVSASINGVPAPIEFASANQLNIQIPYETVAPVAVLSVVNSGQVASISFPMKPVSPGIFSLQKGWALNQNGTFNTASNPAAPGSTISVYFTGLGQVNNWVGTGLPAPVSPPSLPVNTFTAAIDKLGVPLEFVGLAPGTVGVAQANITLANVSAGTHSLTLSAATGSGTFTSNAATVFVGGN